MTLRPFRFAHFRRARPAPRIEQRYTSPFSARLRPFDPVGDRRARELHQRLSLAGALLLCTLAAVLVALGDWL